MKFCGKCGAQMDDSAKVCGQCGTPFASVTTHIPNPPSSQGITPKPIIQTNNLPFSGGSSNSTVLMYLAAVVLNIIMIIMWFVNTIVGKNALMRQGFSLHSLFTYEDWGGAIAAIYIILFILSEVVLIRTILKNGVDNHKRLIFPKIVCILAFLVLLFAFIATKVGSADDYYLYKVYLTFGGWMYFIIDILDLVVLFSISKRMKIMVN